MKKLKTERELKSTEAQHALYMGLTIKWVLVVICALAMVGVLIVLGVYMFNTNGAREELFSQVKNNIGSIIVSIGIFLGLRKGSKLNE